MTTRMMILATTAFLFASSAARADWMEARSQHFIVYANDEPAQVRNFVDRLERFDAAVRVARGVGDVVPGAASRVTVFQLRNLDEVRRLYGEEDSGVAGFYIQHVSGAVAFVPRKSEESTWGLHADNVFFHEYSHHLMYEVNDRPIPTWLSEGFAEFFASPKFNPDGSVTIGAPPKYRGGQVQSVWRMSLDQLVSGAFASSFDYDWVASVYGRGWLLTHYLSYNQARRGQLTKYLNEIEAGENGLKAAKDAFGDLKQLDRELDAYLDRDSFTVSTITADKLKIGPIEIRPLRPSEVAAIEYRALLARGSLGYRAGALAGNVRSVAAKYPDDPAIQTLLAQAEVVAKHPPAAIAAADKALAASDRNDQALIAKGKALLLQGKASGDAAQFETARQLFSKANKIDPENAEPLSLYYSSYIDEKLAPPQRAYEGLQYAIILSPSDVNQRLLAISPLLDAGKYDEVEAILSSIAFNPDDSKWHKVLLTLLDAAKRKDNKAAMDALERAKKLARDDD